MITFYTDGSCTKSRSGWGIIGIIDSGHKVAFAGTEPGATNQRMELRAALEALQWWGDPDYEPTSGPEEITICSDSAYFCNCYYDRWYVNWENNDWVNSKKEPIANRDLWEKIIPYFKNNHVFIMKVKGHSGHTYNELADKLATGALTPADIVGMQINEKNDKINIELSEILLDYSMKKYPVDETIKRIRKACNCE